MSVDLKQVREALNNATTGLGGWKVVIQEKDVAVDGDEREHKFKQRFIYTQRPHPQLKAEYCVVGLGHARDGSKTLWLMEGEAHLIANAPEWLRQMADEIEALRAERDELRDAVSYYESMGGTFHDDMVSATGGNDGKE